jgi:hypothetical protein
MVRKSRPKYMRARTRAQARRSTKTRTSQWFYLTIAAIVALGIVGVVFAQSQRGSASIPPQPANPATGAPGDHWHEAIGVNICGEWLANPAEFTTVAANPRVNAGIHTHGDGFIHVEPQTSADGGNNATLGRWFDSGGWSVSSSSVAAWTGPSSDPTKKSWSNDERCPSHTPPAGQSGHIVWSVNCKTRAGNPASYKLRNGDIIAIGFLANGEHLGVPPSASSAPSGAKTTPFIAGQKSCSATTGTGPTTSAPPAPVPSSSTP